MKYQDYPFPLDAPNAQGPAPWRDSLLNDMMKGFFGGACPQEVEGLK